MPELITSHAAGCEVALVYPEALFKAALPHKPKPTDKPKYSTGWLLPHAFLKTPEYKAILAAIDECAIAKWGKALYDAMVDEGTFQSPFLRSIGSKGYDASVFAMRTSSASGEDYPPTVRLRDGTVVAGPARVGPPDRGGFYSGVRARLSLAPRASGGPGTTWEPRVTLDLRNVQKLADAARIVTGGGTGGSELGALPDAPASSIADMA